MPKQAVVEDTVQVLYGRANYRGQLYSSTIHGVTVWVTEDHKLHMIEYPAGGTVVET